MATTKQKNNEYGYDISLFLDIRKNGSATSGKDLVLNSIVGKILDYDLWYSESYGINLEPQIRTGNVSQFGLIATQTEREILKDDRIESVEVTIAEPDVNGNVAVTIAGVLAAADDTPFELIGNLNIFNASQFNFAAK